jgi:hypothetical protein
MASIINWFRRTPSVPAIPPPVIDPRVTEINDLCRAIISASSLPQTEIDSKTTELRTKWNTLVAANLVSKELTQKVKAAAEKITALCTTSPTPLSTGVAVASPPPPPTPPLTVPAELLILKTNVKVQELTELCASLQPAFLHSQPEASLKKLGSQLESHFQAIKSEIKVGDPLTKNIEKAAGLLRAYYASLRPRPADADSFMIAFQRLNFEWMHTLVTEDGATALTPDQITAFQTEILAFFHACTDASGNVTMDKAIAEALQTIIDVLPSTDDLYKINQWLSTTLAHQSTAASRSTASRAASAGVSADGLTAETTISHRAKDLDTIIKRDFSVFSDPKCLVTDYPLSLGNFVKNILDQIVALDPEEQAYLLEQNKDALPFILDYGMNGVILEAADLERNVEQNRGVIGDAQLQNYKKKLEHLRFMEKLFPTHSAYRSLKNYLECIYQKHTTATGSQKLFVTPTPASPASLDILKAASHDLKVRAFSEIHANLLNFTRHALPAADEYLNKLERDIPTITQNILEHTAFIRKNLERLKENLSELDPTLTTQQRNKIDDLLKSLNLLDAQHILALPTTKEISAPYSQFTIPTINFAGAYIATPTDTNTAPARNVCAYASLYNIKKAMESDALPDPEVSIHLGLSRQHEAIRANVSAPGTYINDAGPKLKSGNITPDDATTDHAKEAFLEIINYTKTEAVNLEAGNELSQYQELLEELHTAAEANNGKAGALIHKGQIFYSVVAKRDATSGSYSYIVMDTHGFDKSSGARELEGHAFAREYNSIESAAKLLYLRTPHKQGADNNQVTFDIYTLPETLTATASSALEKDVDFLEWAQVDL